LVRTGRTLAMDGPDRLHSEPAFVLGHLPCPPVRSMLNAEIRVVSRTRGIEMRLAIGGDHAGFPLKGPIIDVLRDWGHEVVDLGTHSTEYVDFPGITRAVCAKVLDGDADRAILVCGTGVGACIAANKIDGIRAALCHDVYSAHQSVEHDDVNVLCLGAQIIRL